MSVSVYSVYSVSVLAWDIDRRDLAAACAAVQTRPIHMSDF